MFGSMIPPKQLRMATFQKHFMKFCCIKQLYRICLTDIALNLVINSSGHARSSLTDLIQTYNISKLTLNNTLISYD